MTVYYVGTSGDNTTGLTPAAAWTSIATLDIKLGDATISAGDTIYFKGGERFDGVITNHDLNDLSFIGGERVGFGSGKPILQHAGFDFYSSTHFIGIDAKYPLVYKAQSTLATSAVHNGLWESNAAEDEYLMLDHVEPVYVSISDTNPAVVTWTAHGFSNSDDFFVFDRDGGVVGLDGGHIITSIDADSFSIPVDNTTGGVTNALGISPAQIDSQGMWCWFKEENLWYRSTTDSDPTVDSDHVLKRSNQPTVFTITVSAGTLTGHIIDELQFEASGSAVVYQTSGSGSITDLTVRNCYFNECRSGLLVKHASTGTISDIVYKDNIIKLSKLAQLEVANSATRTLHNLYVTGNKCYDYNRSQTCTTVSNLLGANKDPEVIYLQAMNDSIISNNLVQGGTGGSHNDGTGVSGLSCWHAGQPMDRNVISNNIFKNFVNGQTGIQLSAGLLDVFSKNVVENNTVVMDDGYDILKGLNYSGGNLTPDNVIKGNTFIGCGTSISIDSSGEKGLFIVNNVSINPVNYHIECANTNIGANVIAMNSYFPTSGTLFLDGGTALTYSEFLTRRIY